MKRRTIFTLSSTGILTLCARLSKEHGSKGAVTVQMRRPDSLKIPRFQKRGFRHHWARGSKRSSATRVAGSHGLGALTQMPEQRPMLSATKIALGRCLPSALKAARPRPIEETRKRRKRLNAVHTPAPIAHGTS